MERGLIYSEALISPKVPKGYCNGRLAVMAIGREKANKVVIANHYSHTVARTSYIHLGVFVDDVMVGVLQFGYMMNPTLRNKFVEGTGKDQYLELNRMWVDDSCPIFNAESQAVSCAIRYIRHAYPNVKWVQSYADERCGKLGLVYQACSFGYYGKHKSAFWELDGEVYHDILMKVKRGKLWCAKAKYLQENVARAKKMVLNQYHYIKFLDRSWEARCVLQRQRYPKYYLTKRPQYTKVYRGVREQNGEWFFGGLKEIGKDAKALTDGSVVALVKPETVSQFTGLTDKNGKDIYEGDIVSFLHFEKGLRVFHLGVVVDSHDFAHFVIKEDIPREYGEYHDFNFGNDSIQVVGNIYENKKLLTAREK